MARAGHWSLRTGGRDLRGDGGHFPARRCQSARSLRESDGDLVVFAMANSKQRKLSGSTSFGFTLIEVLITLAISTILMTALASIFQRSVSTRVQVDREGQRLENSRFSLDTLTEDIRLAGYFGPLSVPASTINWTYLAPCTQGNAGAGWVATDTNPIRNVPFPIFGYEAHNTPLAGSQTAPGGALDCINVANQATYKAGTDVFLVRRVSTVSGYTANATHVQLSACADAAKDRVPFVVSTGTNDTSTFPLHQANCTGQAPVYRLITRIYFVSTCDDCTGGGDGVPALKVVELGATPAANVFRTVATGVENFHVEYGIDGTGSPWETNIAVVAGTMAYSGVNFYQAAGAGITGTVAPVHTSGTASDGVVNWNYAGAIDGAADRYVVSNNDPRGGGAGTLLTGMRVGTDGENMWEDVATVKITVLARDLTESEGPAITRTFVLGSKDNAGTTLTTSMTDKYRRKVSTSTVGALNMAIRREQ